MAESPPGAARYVLAADGWHPGVIGIVASRIAERHHRPAVLIALDGDEGTGSGRSIPAFDLLGGLTRRAPTCCATAATARPRASPSSAAGSRRSARRSSPTPRATLAPEDLVPEQRIDAVVPGDALHLGLAEELERLAPFGMGNPEPCAARARRAARRPAADGRGPPRRVHARGRRRPLALRRLRARRLAARRAAASPSTPPCGWRSTATTARWSRGSCCATRSRARPAPIEVVGEPEFADGRDGRARARPRGLAGAAAPRRRGRPAAARVRGRPRRRDRRSARGSRRAGARRCSPSTAHAAHRARALRDRRRRLRRHHVGGCSRRDPALAAPYAHVVAVDPPPDPHSPSSRGLPGEGWTHLAWGAPELELRPPRARLGARPARAAGEVYRALRAAAAGPRRRSSEALLDPARAPARSRAPRRGRRAPAARPRGARPRRARIATGAPPPCRPPPGARSWSARRRSASTRRLAAGLAHLADRSRRAVAAGRQPAIAV